ncbi:uncharacterized protein LOC117282397 [Cryptotermes secundus]|uniref:uncharacterized protein LOC117282397 n=1 Tax=Cryptotermes secundus TaxID=105785 RepID=UPI001454D049|nr:uncharacterized protein LOC117282397 [Cryptotermes secundus]
MKTKTCAAVGCFSCSRQGIRFFNFPKDPAQAAVWAGKVGISCTIDSARRLHNEYLCSKHFLDSDFTAAEKEGASANTWQQLRLLRRLTISFDSFNGGMHVDPGKTLRYPLNNSPHIEHWKVWELPTVQQTTPSVTNRQLFSLPFHFINIWQTYDQIDLQPASQNGSWL